MSGEVGVVYKIAYESNSFCNEPCGFCFATYRTPPEVAAAIHAVTPDVDTESTLTTPEVKEHIIDPFKKIGGRILHFTGGDPFLRKDLPELVEYAKNEKGLLVSVDTNGLIVTQPRNRELFERVVPELSMVGLPIDALSKELQITMRGHKRAYQAPLDFLRISEQVRPTVSKFPVIKTNSLVTGLNYRQVPALVDVLEPYLPTKSAERRGLIGRWSIDRFLPMERGATNRLLYEIDRDTYLETVAAAREELAVRGLADVITGDQDKVNAKLLVSPQGIPYVPNGTHKQFMHRSLRNTALHEIVRYVGLASFKRQYTVTLGGIGSGHRYRHPHWEEIFLSEPPATE